jgi:WD40 repeat protein
MQSDDSAIWICKFRKDGRLMATGGQDNVLRLWQVLNHESITHFKSYNPDGEQVPLLNPIPFKEWTGYHQADIFEINWSPKDPSTPYLLSVSADCLVIIWNINFDKPVQILKHQDILCSAIFVKPQSENYVASGCFDKIVRIWNVNQRKVIDWQQTPNYITALQVNQQGNTIVVGLVNGICIVYDYSPYHIDNSGAEDAKLTQTHLVQGHPSLSRPPAKSGSMIVE